MASALIATLFLAQGCAQPGLKAEPASESTVAVHVANAQQAAGPDLGAMLSLCRPAPAVQPPHDEQEKGLAALMNEPAPAPGQAFDNLYFVGAHWVSAWAIKTSDGITLIDALNNPAEASTLIEGGMKRLGLDPAQIKYVIVTHGHADHYGGASYLAQKYHARVVMSDIDWTMTETKLEFSSKAWSAPPKRDIAVRDGDRITLGDTTVTLYVTPGHTLGTLTAVFDVTWQGRKHRVLLWGGTGFNFGKDVPRLNSYARSAERMSELARQQQVDVMLSNHSHYDGSLEKLQALRQSTPGQPNPFVMGTPDVVRTLKVMDECAMAQRDRFLLQ